MAAAWGAGPPRHPGRCGTLARLHAASARHQGFDPSHSTISPPSMGGWPRPVTRSCSSGRSRAGPWALPCYGLRRSIQVTPDLASDRDPAAGRLSVPAAIEWEAIRWAKANGYRWFDFGGVPGNGGLDTRGRGLRILRADEFRSVQGAVRGDAVPLPTPVEIIASPLVTRRAYDLSLRWPAGRRLVERTSYRLRAGRGSGDRGASQVK